MPVIFSQKRAILKRSPKIIIEIPFGSNPILGRQTKMPFCFAPLKTSLRFNPGTFVHVINEGLSLMIFTNNFGKPNGRIALSPMAGNNPMVSESSLTYYALFSNV